MEEPKTVAVFCSKCAGGKRNHDVLCEHVLGEEEPGHGYYCYTHYQVIRCRGCDTIRFQELTHEAGFPEPYGRVFPETSDGPHRVDPSLAAVEVVGSIYDETVRTYNSGAKILAAAGIRACVEAVCKRHSIPGKNLQDRIDKLAGEGLLTKPQAELLHESRYLGNSALHEIRPPDADDLSAALEIVEGLLRTLYIYPDMAKKLRDKRDTAAGQEG